MKISSVHTAIVALCMPLAAVTGTNNVRTRGLQLAAAKATEGEEEEEPEDQRVTLEMWTSPRYDFSATNGEDFGANVEYFENVKAVHVGFGDSAVILDINMYINKGADVCPSADIEGNPLKPPAKKQVCDDSCANQHQYCEPPPTDTKHNKVTGKVILVETLRRQCLWNYLRKDDDWKTEGQVFDYMEHSFKKRCDFGGFQNLCAHKTLTDAQIDGNFVQACISKSGGLDKPGKNTVFEEQLKKQADRDIDTLPSLPAVLVNSEYLEAPSQDRLFAMICKALPEELKPKDVCTDDLEKVLGEDEDPLEAKAAEEELVEEIAEELGETPEEVLGGAEEEQEEEAEAAENGEDGEAAMFVDESTLEEGAKALEEVSAKAAQVKPILKTDGQPVIEVWTTPVLDWDFGPDGGDGPNIALYQGLKDLVIAFQNKIIFRPLPFVFSSEDVCSVDFDGAPLSDHDKTGCADSNCSNNHRYCAVSPEQVKSTGRDLVEESLRRWCLWEVYGRNDDLEDDRKFFDYLAKYHEMACDNTDKKDTCISKVAMEAELDTDAINMCIMNSGGLESDEENGILQTLFSLEVATFAFHQIETVNSPVVIVDGELMQNNTIDELFAIVCSKIRDGGDLCNGELPVDMGLTVTEAPASEESEPVFSSGLPSVTEVPASEESEPLFSEGPQEGEDLEMPEEGGVPPSTESAMPQFDAETSTPKGTWGLNSAGGDDETSPPDITGLTGSAPETASEDSLEALDKTIVDTVHDHSSALAQCQVDTSVLMNNLMALGSGESLKKQAESMESDLPMLMTENCPHKEGVEILHRMEEFHRCAMFDLQALIETFPSTAVGVAMRCANAYSNMTKEEEATGFVPEACIRTLEQDSILGRGLFGLYLYPDVACPCFEKLGLGVPECTADVWPIPINGALVKTQSCLVGQYCQAIDDVCESNLKLLNECLPPKGTSPDMIDCVDTFAKCAAVYDKVPPMLNSAPMPDACMRVAEGSKFYGQHVVERYDTFRHHCGQNIELWEGHTKVAEFKAFVHDGILGIDWHSLPFVSGAASGFLAGIVFTIVFIIVRNCVICVCNCFRRCCCRGGNKKNQRPTAKDYATVETNGDETTEYRD